MPNTFGVNRTLGSAISAIALVLVLSSGAVLNALDQLHEAIEGQRRVVLMLRDLDAFRTAILNQETGLLDAEARHAEIKSFNLAAVAYGANEVAASSIVIFGASIKLVQVMQS